jgi:hypothetical protein
VRRGFALHSCKRTRFALSDALLECFAYLILPTIVRTKFGNGKALGSRACRRILIVACHRLVLSALCFGRVIACFSARPRPIDQLH